MTFAVIFLERVLAGAEANTHRLKVRSIIHELDLEAAHFCRELTAFAYGDMHLMPLMSRLVTDETLA